MKCVFITILCGMAPWLAGCGKEPEPATPGEGQTAIVTATTVVVPDEIATEEEPRRELGPPTNVVYLADLRTVHFHNLYGKTRWGLSHRGKPIKYRGKMYRKGVSTHPHTKGDGVGVCPLNGKYRRFQSLVFVTTEKGSVAFRVEADGHEVFSSGVLTGNSQPLFINVDVTGAQELRMIVNPGKDNFSDHAVWGDPRLLW